jgi:hypothetical protein
VENISAVAIWATMGTDQNQWYYYPLVIGSIIPFFIGIMFLIIYYKFFHPHITHKEDTAESYRTTNNINTYIEDIVE